MPATRRRTTAKKATARKSTRNATRATKTARKQTARKGSGRRTTATAAPKAMSLHIGLNLVDERHYAGWSGPLQACENDANDMAHIAASKGMKSTILRTRDATRRNVLAALRRAAGALDTGDFFLLTYSGHGGQVPDLGDEETDRQDETWCLFDGQLLDDELYLALGRFAKGVRVFVLSDSCHSGTMTRARVDAPLTDAAGNRVRAKLLPPDKAVETYQAHKRFYDAIQARVRAEAGRENFADPDVALSHVSVDPRLGAVASRFPASAILISGCQDNQTSLDGARNGAFTERLLQVWREGAFVGNYGRFHATIAAGMPPTQTPNLFTLGDVATFLGQQPFQVSTRAGRRVTPASARAYVEAARIPAPRRTRGAAATRAARGTPEIAFDAAKQEAAVVGSDVIAFVEGVSAERREAIVSSSLLAQLVASSKVTDRTRVYDWYDAYYDVLTNVGWVVQDRGFAEYKASSTNFEAHEAIIAVATTLLGAAPAALAIVKSTLDALGSMNSDSPWITIFNREAQSAETARFQIGLAEQASDGQVFVNLMAFGLEARSTITQVLFFKAKKQDVTLRYYSGRVTVDAAVLDRVRDAIETKLADHAADYVAKLPDV